MIGARLPMTNPVSTGSQVPEAEVTVFTPLLSPTRHQLLESYVTVGRSVECSIPIKDRYLSRKHAELIVGTDGRWMLRDCGSANGTYLNGLRVEQDQRLRSGDRIRLGDTEVVFHLEQATDRILAVSNSKISATFAIPVREITEERAVEPAPLTQTGIERLRTLNILSAELIEDRPMNQLFGFVVDRVMEHLKPSRAAIGLLTDNGTKFSSVEVRRADKDDSSELAISKTLLDELILGKKAMAFMDIAENEKLSQAKSIVMQGIRSVLCAPMTIGDGVVGLLYVDFLHTQRSISEDDVKLVAQIARFAAMKLETTRLREDAIQKRFMEEEMRTAHIVQKGLLPEAPPNVNGYTLAGRNQPFRSVSGDYYDFVVRADGKIYFVIADVSGKGVTAALIMAGLQSSFRIFAKGDPEPATLVTQLNTSLRETIPRSKFVTLFAGRLDPSTGRVEYANAGHVPPVLVTRENSTELGDTDLILGMRTLADYRHQEVALGPGDSLILFTDGITEAEDPDGTELGYGAIHAARGELFGKSADEIADAVERIVMNYVGATSLTDDLTLMVISGSIGN